MKRNFYHVLTALTILLLSASCKKSANDKPFIEDKDLTACPIGSTCQYLFTERADLGNQGQFVNGDYRLFWLHSSASPKTTSIYFKAPMQGNRFELTKADLLSGKVAVISSCPTCFSIPLVITDGYVKGLNTTPNARADQARWLIDAKVIRSTIDNPGAVGDTLYVKQKFDANFVID